jgi:hypothetical protein
MAFKGFTVFAKHPPDNVSVLDMLIAGRAYGWTTGKTRFSSVGEAECNIFGFHRFPIPGIEAVGKRPSAALPSSLVTSTYFYVRLIPRDFGSLASGHFPSASKRLVF